MQVACEQSPRIYKIKLLMGLLLSCLCILIVVWFICTLNAMDKARAIDNKLTDMILITPDDFGASIRISTDLYDEFAYRREPLEDE